MFSNLTHHPNLTLEQHRALPGIANSDLMALADQLLGREPRQPVAAYAFGTLFHRALLEPARFRAEPVPAEPGELAGRERASRLARLTRQQAYVRCVLYGGQREQSFTAIHEPTGLLVKVRPDLLLESPRQRRRTIVDFKTTSCRDREQFLRTIEAYDYDRQGALYADVLGAHRVVMVAVPKKQAEGKQPQVWIHQLTPEQLALGRKKYGRLLREARSSPHLIPDSALALTPAG